MLQRAAAPIDPVTFEVLNHRLLSIVEEMGIQYMRCSGIERAHHRQRRRHRDHAARRRAGLGRAVHRDPGQRAAADRREHDAARGRRGLRRRRHLHLQRPVPRRDPRARLRDRRADLSRRASSSRGSAPPAISSTPAAWTPGGFSVKAVDVHQEGLRMPPVKLVEAGRVREDVYRWIINQVRDPLVGLDVRGQIAALNTGRGANRRADRGVGRRHRQGRDAALDRARARQACGAPRRAARRRVARRAVHRSRRPRAEDLPHPVHDAQAGVAALRSTSPARVPNARGLINSTWSGLAGRGAVVRIHQSLLGHPVEPRRARLHGHPGASRARSTTRPIPRRARWRRSRR